MQLALSSGVLFISLVLQQNYAPFRTLEESIRYKEMTVPKADVVLPTSARDRDADARRQRRAALRQSRRALPPPLLHRITIRDRNGLQTTGLLLSCGVLSLALFFNSLARAKRQGQGLDEVADATSVVGVAFLNVSTAFMLSQIVVPLIQAASPMGAARLNRVIELALAPVWPSSIFGSLRVTVQARMIQAEREAQEAAKAATMGSSADSLSAKERLVVLGVADGVRKLPKAPRSSSAAQGVEMTGAATKS